MAVAGVDGDRVAEPGDGDGGPPVDDGAVTELPVGVVAPAARGAVVEHGAGVVVGGGDGRPRR